MMMIRIALSGVLLATALGFTAKAGSPDSSQAVRSFVQSFYNSYTALASGIHDSSPLETILAKRRSVLSPELFRALKADDDAQRKVSDDVVGLDFDPFLNTQEQAGHYTIGRITASQGIYRVEIRERGSSDKLPDVIAEVAREGGNLVFVNFIYPGNGDLLSVLKTLAQERDRAASPSH